MWIEIAGCIDGEPSDLEEEPREPWQETGQRCGWTDTGICQARIAKTCVWPHCVSFPPKEQL